MLINTNGNRVYSHGVFSQCVRVRRYKPLRVRCVLVRHVRKYGFPRTLSEFLSATLKPNIKYYYIQPSHHIYKPYLIKQAKVSYSSRIRILNISRKSDINAKTSCPLKRLHLDSFKRSPRRGTIASGRSNFVLFYENFKNRQNMDRMISTNDRLFTRAPTQAHLSINALKSRTSPRPWPQSPPAVISANKLLISDRGLKAIQKFSPPIEPKRPTSSTQSSPPHEAPPSASKPSTDLQPLFMLDRLARRPPRGVTGNDTRAIPLFPGTVSLD